MTDNHVDLTFTRMPIRVSGHTYKGERKIDIRHHFEKDGKLLPTQKGIQLPIAALPTLKDAIGKVMNGNRLEKVENGAFPVFVDENEFNGKKLFHVRHYYVDNGEWKPTSKGVCLSATNAKALIMALEEIEQKESAKVPSLFGRVAMVEA